MSKYDFEIDLSKNSSTGLILNRIKRGSTVLEFGCANGRMTRYMNNVLGCKVYIVEYDKSAYTEALEYAQAGICEDILNFTWLEEFKGIEFDAIIFADVLEHLSAPSEVVKKAALLLKPNGEMHISVPNITHNDILLKLYENHFDYTSIGILDNTHVCFWGLENLKNFFDGTGVFLNKVDATYCPTGYTEQYNGTLSKRDSLLNDILNERECGEVYQFVLTLSKCKQETIYLLKKPVLKSNIYINTGKGFNSKDIIPVECEHIVSGTYSFFARIKNIDGLKGIRVDPIEGQGCIIKNLVVKQEGNDTPLCSHNGYCIENGILFLDTDPMVMFNDLSDSSQITISADIIIGEEYMRQLGREYLLLQKNNKEKQELLDTIEELKKSIGAYIVVADRKDRYAISLENELNSLITYKIKIFLLKIIKKIKSYMKIGK